MVQCAVMERGDNMRLKDIVVEDFCNYKLPSMFLITATCDWKCGRHICQNQSLANLPDLFLSNEDLLQLYETNEITKAVVLGGLEPFMQFDELLSLIRYFRENGEHDDFVIYTGYRIDEIQNEVELLKAYGNIIVKFGRYDTRFLYPPGPRFTVDKLLGVPLATMNQYSVKIS